MLRPRLLTDLERDLVLFDRVFWRDFDLKGLDLMF